jgi:antitoxin CptB
MAMIADPELAKNRLSWRCRRGMLELDTLLQGFLQRTYENLTDADKKVFVILLEYPDAVLFDLLMGRTISTDQEIERVVEKIRAAAAP